MIEDLTLFFQHVNPSSVVIGGHSMGGYFGLFGAAELQKAFPEIAINFISDRSIWTLESRISVKVEAGGYTGLSKAAMSLYIKSVINSPDWARDSFEALESLKGKVLIIFHKKDGVMLLKDSVYIGLSKAQQTKDYHILELTEEDPSIDAYPYPHNRALTDKENHILIAEIGQMLGIPTPGY